MHKRCNEPKRHNYKHYGGRGIKVCARWSGRRSFLNFWHDMKDGWQPGYTIDRIDCNGNYEPGNCRWVPAAKQNSNKRNTRRVTTPVGVMTIADLARRYRFSYEKMRDRVLAGQYPTIKIYPF
jgi:hypothetical protein